MYYRFDFFFKNSLVNNYEINGRHLRVDFAEQATRGPKKSNEKNTTSSESIPSNNQHRKEEQVETPANLNFMNPVYLF